MNGAQRAGREQPQQKGRGWGSWREEGACSAQLEAGMETPGWGGEVTHGGEDLSENTWHERKLQT